MNKVLLGDIKKVLLYLTFPLVLTGCGKKAECNVNHSREQQPQTPKKTTVQKDDPTYEI